jgi:5-methylcytosine-specific restriction endonuclease McrA
MADHRSDEAQAYRALYKTRAWTVTRRQQLAEEPLCRMCKADGRVTAANVVDHVKAHKGDRVLFFDAANLQSLCAPCHDRHKQQQERLGYSTRVGLDGWPLDPMHPSNR